MSQLSRRLSVIAFLSMCLSAAALLGHAQESKPHRLAIQVSTADPAVMALALSNVVNVSEEYARSGEEIEVEIVAYGPGLNMLREDTSPVKARVKSIAQSMPYVTFRACGNTQATMSKNEGKEIVLLPEAKVVKAGVVRLMELQEAGWSYIHP